MELKFHDILSDDTVPVQKHGLTLGKTVCCYFLQNEAHEPVLKLNETSALIWSLCTGEQNVGQIIASLIQHFAPDDPETAQQIKKDILRVFDTFEVEEVIRV